MMANEKISELTAATMLAGDEALPIQQGAGNARTTPDQLALHALRRLGRRTIIGAAGDSIADFFMCSLGRAQSDSRVSAGSPLAWALALYPADVMIDGRQYANGGYNFGVGGTTSAQMLADQLPQIEARPPDVLFIQTHQNDNIAILSDVTAQAPNTENTALGALAAGVKLVVILSCPPHNSRSGATRAKALAGLNERFARFALATPGVIYLDTLGVLLDPTAASTTLVPYRGSAAPTAFGSYSSDGVHPTAMGCKAQAPLIADVLRMIAPMRHPRAVVFSGGYDGTNNPKGNLLKDSGFFTGTGGKLNGATDANVAANWELTANNGVTVTPSLVTDALGYPAQRLELGGTATATATVELKLGSVPSYVSPSPGPGDFELECQARLNELAGAEYIRASAGMGGVSTFADSPVGVEAVTQEIFLASRRPAQIGSGSSFGFSFRVVIPNGVSPTGSIDISRFGVWRVD